MTLDTPALDSINVALIDLLQADGRMSLRELADRIHLSPPAVAERIRKLEQAGIIAGYRAVIDYEAVGFPLLCVIRLNAPRGSTGVDEAISAIPEVIEALRVTGSESHVIRARVRDTAHLEALLHRLWEYGDSVTNIATSYPVRHRPMPLAPTLA